MRHLQRHHATEYVEISAMEEARKALAPQNTPTLMPSVTTTQSHSQYPYFTSRTSDNERNEDIMKLIF